jgi:septal ring factor EnvC (AmiA/AmiB activator)
MALTDQDLRKISHLFDDKFDRIDAQFGAVRGDIDNLALATAQQFAQVDMQFAQVDKQFAQVDMQFAQVDKQFAQVHSQLSEIKEDLAVVKDVVKDHSFRLSRLEHRVRPIV